MFINNFKRGLLLVNTKKVSTRKPLLVVTYLRTYIKIKKIHKQFNLGTYFKYLLLSEGIPYPDKRT